MRNERVFTDGNEVSKASMVLFDINAHVKEIAKKYKNYAMTAFNEFKEVMYIAKTDKRFKVTKGLKLKQSFIDKTKQTLVFHFQDVVDKVNCELVMQPYCRDSDSPEAELDYGYHLYLEMEKNKEVTTLRDPARDFEERYEKYKNELLDSLKYKNQKS